METTPHNLARQGLELTAVKSLAGFQANLRSIVRLRWNDERTDGEFYVAMFKAIEKGFREAWAKGAAECGIKFSELTTAETNAMQDKINSQFEYITTFGGFVAANTKANGGKLGTLFGRLRLWVNGWYEVAELAKSFACRDKKMRWDLGFAEHCRSCMKLAGKVKRMSFWREKGIIPKQKGAWYLECGGWECKCELNPTDEPISPGPLPSLP